MAAITDEHSTTGHARERRSHSWTPRHIKRERLEAALATFEQEKFAASAPSQLQAKVETALKEARTFSHDGKLHAAWGSLAAARRLEILTLTRAALEVRASALAREAGQKLRGWRKETAAALLSEGSPQAAAEIDAAIKELRDVMGAKQQAVQSAAAPPQAQSRYRQLQDNELQARAWLVAHLLDGASDNTYFKHELRGEAVRSLLSFLVLLILAAVFALTPIEPFPPTPSKPDSMALLPYVALFGALGACFSGLRSLLAPATDAIPDVVLSVFATAIRPAIGAAGAVVIFLAQQGGLIEIAKGSPAAVLTVAFVAGFSEALVLRVVGSVESKPAKE